MKTRLLTMGAAVCISAGLVACGGGGGGGGGTPPTPAPTIAPTSTPTPTPTPVPNPYGCVGQAPFAIVTSRQPMANPPHPIATGDTFVYSGTLAKTYTQSAPCPQPTATSAASVSVSVSNAAANSPSGATDTASTETDTYPTQTVSTTTHQIVAVTGTSPNQQYQLYSTKSTDSIGNAIATSYTNPQVLDMLPETSGQAWGPNNPAATVTEALADGTSIARNVSSDGSYTETETFVNGVTTKISVDGAASGKPLDGGGVYTIGATSFSYAPPAGGSITLTIGTNPPKTRTFPSWFTPPSGSYISDTFVNNGSKTFDQNCQVSASIGTSGNQIVETYQVLDPVLGYIETRTTTSYIVNGFGAACVKIDDALNSYYDYQNDTTKIDYQSQNGQPNSFNHIVEYLGMSSPTTPYPSIRRPQSVSAVSPVTVAARIAAIDHTRAVERAQRIESLHNFATQYTNKGAVR